jgi:signal recognition particle subunit SRP54
LAWATLSALSNAPPKSIQAEEAEKLAAKMAKGQFDINDLRAQLRQMTKMGGLGAIGRA